MKASEIIQQVADAIAGRIRGDAAASDPLGILSRPRDAFFIAFDFNPIAALATDKQPFTLDTDADYLIQAAIGDVRDNANPVTRIADPALTALIAMSSSGRQLMTAPIHWNNLFGTAQLMNEWPAPKYLAGGTTINITLTNLGSGAVVYKPRVALWGYKLFARG